MPVLDVFGRAPEVFTEAKANSADLWWFAFVVAVLPPLLLVTTEVIVTLLAGNRFARVLHIAIVALLGMLFSVRAIRLGADIEGIALFALAVLTAGLLAVVYTRLVLIRQWLRYGSFAPLLFAGIFLFSSPAHSIAQGAGKKASTAIPVVATAENRPPIVLLVLDELPIRSLLDSDGKIDAERFPGFASLSEDSTWFRNATSVASHTVNAVPAIFTGRYPSVKERSPIAREHPNSIFRLFGNAYRFNVSELTTQLCAVPRCDIENPENAPDATAETPKPVANAPKPRVTKSNPSPLSTLLETAADTYRQMVALHNIETTPDVDHDALVAVPATTAPTTTTIAGPVDRGSITPTTVDRGFDFLPVVQPTRFSEWLDRIDGDIENPELNVLHIQMPHGPFHVDSKGTNYRVPDDAQQLVGFAASRWSPDEGAVISVKQRHLLQVRYVDTLITVMKEHLVAQGIWDEAVVIVTADHGASFDPGGRFRELDDQSQVDVLGIPLFVHAPEFEQGVTDDRPVQSVDIAPTLAALADIDQPWPVDGVNLADLGDLIRTKYRAEALRPGEYYETKTVDVSRHLQQLLARLPSPGTDGGDDLTILRNGPSGQLIGKRVEDLKVALDSPAGTVEVEFPPDKNFSPTETGTVAAFIIGDISTGGANQTIVVVVDGRIGATSLTFDDGTGHASRFAALIPPTWMTAKSHEVSFYLLADDGALLALS